jgi:hypothetical protein
VKRSLPDLRIFLFSLLAGCAAGPRDALDGSGQTVRDAGPPPPAYSYVARQPLVAVGLAGVQGLSDEDARAAIDRVAAAASACFRRSQNLAPGAARITLPIDAGGIAGAPAVTFAPESAAPLGMLCVLAPVRMSTFAPAAADAGARSLTIESAWGP